MSSFAVKGLDELLKKLESMGTASNKVSTSALKAGGKIVVDKQRQDAPKDTGAGANALKVGKITTAKSKNKYVQIGIPDGDTWMKAKGIYFQHYGFYNHVVKRYIAGTLWMDKSMMAVKSQVEAAMKNELEKGLKL